MAKTYLDPETGTIPAYSYPGDISNQKKLVWFTFAECDDCHNFDSVMAIGISESLYPTIWLCKECIDRMWGTEPDGGI